MRRLEIVLVASTIGIAACSSDASTSPRPPLLQSVKMESHHARQFLGILFKKGPRPNTVISSTDPTEFAAAASQAPPAQDAEGLRKVRDLVSAAWKVQPVVAMMNDPLPAGVIAQVVRPVDVASPPVIVFSRLSTRPDVLGAARGVLVQDIVQHPRVTVERTLDLHDDGSIVKSDGTKSSMMNFENVAGNFEERRAAALGRLERVKAKFAAAPVRPFHGKSVHLLPWPM